MYNVTRAGNLIDNQSGQAYEVFRFINIEDKVRHIRIEREHSRDIKYIYRALLKANADLPLEEHIAHDIIRVAITAEGDRNFNYATQFGWQQRQTGFMLGSRYIAAKQAEARLLPPIWAEEDVEGPLHVVGSLSKWQKLVAGRLSGSARLDVLLMAAFAAPLVRFTNEPNPGLNFVGLKLAEFEIASALVGSVLGQHAHEAVSDWWIKPSMLMKRVQQFNDMLFVAGDLICCPELMNTRQQYDRLQTLRSGRTSVGISKSVQTRTQERWRGIFVTLLQHATRHPGSPGTAADVSFCLDVPPNSRLTALVDPPFQNATEDDLRQVAMKLLQLADHARKQRGTPMRRYIHHLVLHRCDLEKRVKRLRAEFVSLPIMSKLAVKASQALNCFALLYAGGCLAIEAGVLPWTKERLAASLAACLQAMVRHERAAELTPARIRRVLRTRLRSSSIVRQASGRRFGPDQHDGYYKLIRGRRLFTVHTTAFRSWFGDSSRCAAAVAWLHEEGLLVMGAKPYYPTPNGIEWAERTPRWPDGRVQKSFVFYKPPRKAGRKPR